jgi:transposase
LHDSSSKKRRLDRIAPKHAAILACRPTERLSEQQRILFEQVAVNCPIIRSMRFLALDFREAIATQDMDGMLHWIRTATQSGIGPLVRFAYGLKKDFNAVIAAVETSWSNGQTEGQINRLKAIKRSDVWACWIPFASSARPAVPRNGALICTESPEDPISTLP